MYLYMYIMYSCLKSVNSSSKYRAPIICILSILYSVIIFPLIIICAYVLFSPQYLPEAEMTGLLLGLKLFSTSSIPLGM